MNVTFRAWDPTWASTRLRAVVPQRELDRIGVKQGRDWLVIGKHGWSWEQETRGYGRVCFDVCDDHFHGKLGAHYHAGCARADRITCNSAEMARVIKAKTGRDAHVIPEPYEQPETPARHPHDRLLWFGHQSNLVDLEPWAPRLQNLEIVTNRPGFTQWTPEALDAEFARAGLVVIPTGKSMAKSANRAVDAIRRGLFVVAGYLPAYSDLGIWMGDICDGVAWALSHRDEAIERVVQQQRYVAAEYAPERIGRLWLEVLR